MRKHIAVISVCAVFPAQRKRLARRTARHDINPRKLVEIKILNVALEYFFRVKVAAQRSTGIWIEFHKRAVFKAGQFETFCQAACA